MIVMFNNLVFTKKNVHFAPVRSIGPSHSFLSKIVFAMIFLIMTNDKVICLKITNF